MRRAAPPRTSRTKRARYALVAATLAGTALLPGSASAATQDYPTYKLDATTSLSSSLRGDIAGSAFVDKDGAFHWLSSYATYASTDTGSYTNTFTNSDLGALNAQVGAGTTQTADDTYWNHPGSLCYQIDKAASHPAPSPFEDDHCDVVGVWVDPATGAWHGVVNDEYDFNPWGSGTQTQNQRIGTGIHANRILTATSTDKGVNWTFGGEIITSPFTDHDAFDTTAQPGKSWCYGVAGTRLFVDYATGYFYVVYNTQIKMKPGYTTFASWPAVARAPISGGMAPGTWNKYDDGTWQQPGIAGEDGNVGNALGLVARYVPSTDAVDFTGTGEDGKAVDYQSVYAVNSVFAFRDAAGAVYNANTGTGVITDANGATVSSVSYQDPALNSAVTVSTVSSKVSISMTDANGTTSTGTAGAAVLEDTTTHRLYLSPNVVQESAFTYNTYSGGYLSVGYDTNVYQTFDLGKPNGFAVVGAEPAGASSSYLTSIDSGSLTNQGVSGRSYRMLSALNGGAWDVTMTPHSAGQTRFVVGKPPVDGSGTPISGTSTYGLSVGGTALADGGGTGWKLVSVADSFDPSYASGFYKVQNVATGQYLQATGGSPAAARAIGAAVGTGAAQPNFSAAGNSNNGAPGGADQWYLQPIGADTPATLSATSSAAQIAAATNTSLAGATRYKLVNRNSGLVLENVGGTWRLAGQSFGDAAQALAVTKVS